jgi:hypothetical protein
VGGKGVGVFGGKDAKAINQVKDKLISDAKAPIVFNPAMDGK